MLSCTCNIDDGGWWYLTSGNITFHPLKTTKRKRCYSCKAIIDLDALCMQFPRYRSPKTEIEEQIYGDEVPLAFAYLCESCGEIFLNLNAAGYCYFMGDDLRENLMDYWDLTGFKPNHNLGE